MKKFFCIFLILCFAVTGCSTENNQDATETSVATNVNKKAGGTIQMACVPTDTLNPLVTKHASVSDFLSLVYEGLFECSEDLTAVPVLASEYSVSTDNTVYTIKLKKGIKFHDGSHLTSADVMATLDYIFLYEGKFSALKNSILTYDASSPESFSITLSKPVADFVNCLDFPILSSGLTEDDFLPENSNFKPIGTGMYKYDHSEDHKNICLTANNDWHNKKKPYIRDVNVQILADADTIVAAFDAGVIDVVTTSWRTPVEMNLTSSIYNTFKTEQNRLTFMGINCACAEFDTVEERQYMSSVIDSTLITEDVMLDNAVPAKAPLRENVYFNQSVSDEEDEPEIVKPEVVKPESEEGDGIAILYNSDSKTKERLAYTVKYELENKGFLVLLDPQPFNEYVSKVAGNDYDMYVGEVNIDNSGNLEFMFGETRNGQNICAYKTEELTNHISNLNRMTNKENKSVIWNNFKKYYSDTAFQIPLYFTNGCSYVNKKIGGKLAPNLSNLLSGFENLYVVP